MLQTFSATARVTVDLKDLVDEGRYAKEFTFNNIAELMAFMDLLDEARARAQLTYAQTSNELA